MNITLIKNNKELKNNIASLRGLMEKNPEPDEKTADKIKLLALVIEDYEKQHYPIPPPTPLDDDLTYPHEVAMKIAIESKSPIQAWREYLKISQKEMAKRMRITQSAVSQIEKADAKPQKATIEKAARALKINPALLEDL